MDEGKKSNFEQRLAAGSWGTFFLWVAASLWAGLSWGVALIGIAVITLGTQAIRAARGLNVETFWIIAGFLFAAAGVSSLFSLFVGIRGGAVAVGAIGIALILFALVGRKFRRA